MQRAMKKIMTYVGAILASIVIIPSLAMAAPRYSEYSQEGVPHEAFVLFYMSSCPHCKRFDPVLKEYAESHHMPVLAYTLDGQSLPSFPRSVTPTQEEVQHFFPNGNPVVPNLFVIDMSSKRIVPVLQGEATMAQLSSRMERFHQLREGVGNE